MGNSTSRERLQPALLDRLTDEDPSTSVESAEQRVFSLNRLRESVVRDLQWLFNTGAHFTSEQAALHPEVSTSVLNYGVPNFAGMPSSGIQIREVENAIRASIWAFEPRLLRDSVRVKAVTGDGMDHRAVVFEISANLWAEPVPLEMLLRTEVNLESGHAMVRDAGRESR
jgi:type VI secretion system protein ImpF